MKNNKFKDNKPSYYYLIIALVAFVILQFVVLPWMTKDTVKEVRYDEFLKMVDDKKVDKIVEQAYEYRFTLKGESEKDKLYKVGKWDDKDLTKRLELAGVKFAKEIKPPLNPILSYLITLLPMILIFLFVGRMLSKQMGNGPMGFGKSKAKVHVKDDLGITFKNVAGQDEAKESLLEIVDFLHNPKKYASIGAIAPKGVLLVGPPGTGKTLMAKAVAGEANVPFFSISGSEFVEMFVGLGAVRVRDLFKDAKEKAPCIVFIDEIDAIGKKRDTSGYSGNDEREQTLNQLLNEMDGFDAASGVIVLAATNRPEILDPALTRPGRFDRQVRVELPDVKGREDILKVHADKVKIDPNTNLQNIAKMTAGASGADLANIINEGALRAVRENRDQVTEEDLQESVEVVIAGHKKKNAVITQKEKEIIAYHEVGHALVAAKQEDTAPVTKITIIPRTSGTLGYTMQVEEHEKVLVSKEDLFKEIVILTGGRSAEELIFNTKTTGAWNDIERATKTARAMVSTYGMIDEFDFIMLEERTNQYLGSNPRNIAANATNDKIDSKVMEIISSAHKTAYKILEDNIDKLHEISQYLLEKETITGEQFMDILRDEYILTERLDFIKDNKDSEDKEDSDI
ncbi:MAG: ATP-dependent zinc metalloprotease FtsH [Tissierellia bacterium]|nr:ATP-dependent zinc metalloprotease FtsH [Tissierellia bacterium]